MQGKDMDVDSGCDEGTGRGTCGVLPSSQQMDQEMMAVEAAVAAAQLEADEPPPATAGEEIPSQTLVLMGRVRCLPPPPSLSLSLSLCLSLFLFVSPPSLSPSLFFY
jgi:hypothetical protein